MPIIPSIKKICRVPETRINVDGFNRDRDMVVEVHIRQEDWHTIEPEIVVTDTRLPAEGSAWPASPYPTTHTTTPAPFVVADAGCLLRGYAIEQQNNLHVIRIVYRYSTSDPNPAGSLPQELRRDPNNTTTVGRELGFQFSHSTEIVQVPYTVDSTGASATTNTAGDPYSPALTRPVAVRTLSVTRLESIYRQTFWESYIGTTNNSTWNNKQPHRVLCSNVTNAEWRDISGKLWFPVTYTFQYAVDNVAPNIQPTIDLTEWWYDRVLQFGFNARKAIGARAQPIMLKGGPATVPQPLDSDGLLADNIPLTPAEKKYRKLLGMPFALLEIKLPTDVPYSYTTWSSGVNYVVGDRVLENSNFYRCLVAHTSGVFATDLAAAKWALIV